MRILLVEDEALLAETVTEALQREGFEVDCAADGCDGYFKAKEGQYALVLLDLGLPEMSGQQVCHRLREAGLHIPILMLSGRQDETSERESLELGADDFVRKPFSLPLLSARVRALLRRGRPRADLLRRVGDLELELPLGACRRAGAPIELTGRERAVLEFLMRSPGVVQSKQAILDAVWGFDHEGDYNVVEVYVRYLREKIDRPFRRRSIETVRGAGYRIVAGELAGAA